MTIERHQYRLVRWAFLSLAGITFIALAWLASWLVRWLPYGFGQAADCGCVSFAFQVPPWVVASGAGLLGLTIVGFGRWLNIFRRHLVTWRQAQRTARQHGRQLFHQRARLGYWLVESTRPQAYTVGTWRPQVMVTSGLVSQLNRTEFEAVLRHEAAHQHQRDPLWGAVIDATGGMFGWPRWLREWAAAAYSWRELIADAEATSEYASVEGLSGAVLKLATDMSISQAVNFSPNHDRVEKLLNPTWTPRHRLWSRGSLLGIGLGLGILVATLWGAQHVQASLPPYPAGQCPRPVQAQLCQNISSQTNLNLWCVHQGDWQCQLAPSRLFTPDVPISIR